MPRPRTPLDERKAHDVTVTGTLNLLQAARAEKVHRFVFSSSAAVYGSRTPLLLHEEVATHPNTAEGAQKLGDRLVTRMEAAGTYQPTAMMGGPQPAKQPGTMMLGAIIPGADANWFFRCVGPQKTIDANRAAFDGFIASIE